MDEKEQESLLLKVSKQTKEAVKEAQEEALKTVKDQIENSKEGLMTSEGFEEKMKSLGIDGEFAKEMKETIEAQGEEMRKLGEKSGNNVESLDQLFEEKSGDLAKIATGEKAGIKLQIGKKTLVQRTAVANTTMGMVLPGIGELPYLGTVMSGMFRHAGVSPNSNGVIRYYDQLAITRGAGTVLESARKPESAITWEEQTLALKKIADSIPVSKEAFADVGFIKSELERLLDVNLALKEDQQIYSGDGIGANLTGLITTAPVVVPVASIQDPTLYDLLAVLRVGIMNGKQSKYVPNAVLLNPTDILKYKLAKGTDGHYVLPPFITADGAIIDGMKVVESSQVTLNSLVLGDFKYGTIYDLEGVTVSMGHIDQQFIENTFTMLAEKREGLLIRNIDADAFGKITDVDAAIAAIVAP